MTAKNGYCSVCGTPLEYENVWEENKSSFGPAGHNFKNYYCPKCRADEEERKRHLKYVEEQKRIKEEEETNYSYQESFEFAKKKGWGWDV